MTNPAHEVFDTNYDYHYAAEQRKSGEKGLVQKLGARALNWFRGMNAKRKAEKAERKTNGSLHDIIEVADEFSRQERKQPRPVMAEPGLYRSNFSGEQPGATLDQDDSDELMRAAAFRARKALGELPVLAMHKPEQPQEQQLTNTPYRDEYKLTPQTDDDRELIERLERAFNNPRQPDRSGHVRREPEDDDTLVGTSGK